MFGLKLVDKNYEQEKEIRELNKEITRLRKENQRMEFEGPMSKLRNLRKDFMGSRITPEEYKEAIELLDEVKSILIICRCK